MNKCKILTTLMIFSGLFLNSNILTKAMDRENEAKDKSLISICEKEEKNLSTGYYGMANPYPERKTKEQILRNYVLDLSEFQSIGLKTGMKGEDGKELTVNIPAAVHFKDREGREKIVVYNSHLPSVINAFRLRLQSIYNKEEEQRKESLNKSIAPSWFLPELRKPSKKHLLEIADTRLLYNTDLERVLSSNKPDIEILVDICTYLRCVLLRCGDNMENTSTPCAFMIDVKAFNDGEFSRKLIEKMETPIEYYNAVEAGLYRIASSDLSDRDMVIALDHCLDEFLYKLKPRASDLNAINFCFALSRVDYYLSRLEKRKADRTVEELEVMDKLRRKIESLYIEHRFIFIRSGAPILNIPIDYGQVILNTDSRSVMFIDRIEVQERFIKRLEDMLDTKFSIIKGQYDFEACKPEDLRRLANELRPESYQEMIDKMQQQILILKEQEELYRAGAEAKKVKVAFKAIETGISLGVETFRKKSSSTDKQTSQSSDSKYNFTEKDVRDYVSEEERLKSQQQVIDPLDILLDTDFSNPINITVDELPEIQEPDEEDMIDTGFPSEIIVRQPNETSIGKVVQKAGLTPEDIDILLESMSQYLKSLRIKGEIKLKQNQCELIKRIRDNESDYQNLFLLYIKLLRHNFLERNDFGGVIIDERRDADGDGRGRFLREYFVQEVQKLESDL